MSNANSDTRLVELVILILRSRDSDVHLQLHSIAQQCNTIY